MIVRRSTRFLFPALLAGAAVHLAGCSAQLGPRTVPVSRLAYNQAVARSWDEQILLNLVRMRYRDAPLFVDVGSITTQFGIGAAAAANLGVSDANRTTWDGGLGFDLEYSERPTITYTPLRGEEFVTRILSPITPSTLVLLSQSGWSLERLLICCVQEINGLRNAVAAAGPTPDTVPQYADFHRLADRLHALQRAELLRVEPDDDGAIVLQLPAEPPAELAVALNEVRSLLGVPAEATELRTVAAHRSRRADELAVTGRSLLGVLFFLSQAVDVPPADAEAGLVTVTRDGSGAPFDWGRVTDRLLQVRVAERPPAGAAVAIPYRGHWFFIDDRDLSSKSTLNLLSFLFALKAGSQGGKEPLLTLGVN